MLTETPERCQCSQHDPVTVVPVTVVPVTVVPVTVVPLQPEETVTLSELMHPHDLKWECV